jgi:hypothetical protein
MCSEEDPLRCHRHHLIEASLRDRNVEVFHIRGDGSVQRIQSNEAQMALSGFN